MARTVRGTGTRGTYPSALVVPWRADPGDPRAGETCLQRGGGDGGNLAARTVAELRQLCKDAGVASSGKKLDLIKRLFNDTAAEVDQESDETNDWH